MQPLMLKAPIAGNLFTYAHLAGVFEVKIRTSTAINKVQVHCWEERGGGWRTMMRSRPPSSGKGTTTLRESRPGRVSAESST